jgi:tungstate transport system substrate-binding protein
MRALAAFLLAFLVHLTAAVAGESIILQSTTSTQNSGLLDWLLPKFEKKTGIRVKVVAVGTGQALKNAARGDGDVVLVHARRLEEAFLRAGHGIDRRDVMYNDFVIVCPKDDPAGIAGLKDAAEAFRRIARKRVKFVSRADDSGTHHKELALWKDAGINPKPASGAWYIEAGRGMGATLNMAAAMGACTLTDRGTWIAHGNRGDLTIVVQGDSRLFNQYGVMLVNPKKHPHVKEKAARAFIDWLTGAEGQRLIAAYRLKGQQLFFPNAGGSTKGAR